ncbi:hypothetical protein QM012_006406 [Aureobasidium pullulans]|uniref:Uncharacterized protein n=1 Tax=Aureobasidium pullulans TaxID=5580 RepID=A0ABR0TPH5_AURPU
MATAPVLIQEQAKKICRLVKWLLNTQNKLRTTIKESSSTTFTTTSAAPLQAAKPDNNVVSTTKFSGGQATPGTR